MEDKAVKACGRHAKISDAETANEKKLPLWQHILILFAIFVGLQALFFVSSVCAAALPKEPILNNIEASQESSLVQYFDYSHEVFGSSVSFDNNRFIESFAKQDDYEGDPVKASALNMIEYTMPGTTTTIEYFRYWHGWQLPIFLLLMIGNLDFVSIVLGIFAFGSAVFFLLQLRHYLGWIPATVFSLVAFLSTNIIGNFMGDILLSFSISIVILFCAISLKVGRNPNRGVRWQDCICFTSACLFCFFDFFTIPSYAIAMAVFSGMLASGCLKSNFKQGVLLFIRFAIIFLLGFILTWVSKWAFAACYLGIPFVVENVFGEIGLWSGSGTDEASGALRDRFPRLFAIAKSVLYVLDSRNADRAMHWNIAGIIVFAVFLVGVVLIVLSMVKMRKRETINGGVWSILLPALFIPAAIFFMYHHVIFHMGIFGYKPWAFFFADVACLGCYLFLRIRSSTKYTNKSLTD
ncbi:hypothetical protein [Adlercreutzia sp. ZJ154]|uniref:hypothetical protein n=1 Tax=Adlercreutzia sp. ZJ154 TaxID=2709790 RepID=UPI0013EC9BD6|nr:hypothetical protein [Adlercreutzia sp. ZJ154]